VRRWGGWHTQRGVATGGWLIRCSDSAFGTEQHPWLNRNPAREYFSFSLAALADPPKEKYSVK
jgi:hypothetical protein